MITKHDAMIANRFHEEQPRKDGGCFVWRRNGATLTWVTRPDDFRVPVKYGLRSYGQITPDRAGRFHTEENCPYGNT